MYKYGQNSQVKIPTDLQWTISVFYLVSQLKLLNVKNASDKIEQLWSSAVQWLSAVPDIAQFGKALSRTFVRLTQRCPGLLLVIIVSYLL